MLQPHLPTPDTHQRLVARAGVTLIELLVVLAVASVLALLAYPGYAEQVRRSRRVDAQTVLMEASQFMQRWHAAKNSYAGADEQLPYVQAPRDGPAHHRIEVDVPAGDAHAYTLIATPLAVDARCGRLTLTHTGQRGLQGNHSASVADCWR
jgi:type IV pilus assembly protein PilE